MIISNGANRPLNADQGALPDVSGAMLNYFQPMTFGVVTKTVVDFDVVETEVDVTFQGVWQPYQPREVEYIDVGQRAWDWFRLHAEPGLILTTDQVVKYLGRQFRVKSQTDYRLYGYVEYKLIEDYTGSGPQVVTP